MSSFSNFLFGQPGMNEQISTLSPQAQGLYEQLMNALSGQSASGAFGDLSKYYQGLLSGEDFDVMAAPEFRRFREEIMPSLAEQFAGMGSGALSSGNYKLAQGGAATDLAERLAALRAQLRQQGAAGLSGLAQQGFMPTVENIYRPAKEGFLSQALGPALGAIGTAFGAPVLGAIGSGLGKKVSSWFNPGEIQKGSTSPYGEV